ncbi:hypothetical protein TSTA_122980 [Talaromyces stipitatus ATCC 10500]|uniref:Uncharacterized protein n=1 Tax=Talaromyces stipitatus (strain ATCC 10500 / CBS 375.48 / QM 6759 / NRRL 1006) TaxID=441959 RepID=B8MCC3_TALSN|nr:uncharacterized protein TSTA_122980 [Talaromyces stipitatus ATCC 10500]EED18569.1 hypothetical protein TSTA_122980 [Talaromyces stipitatus ATCC 10500]
MIYPTLQDLSRAQVAEILDRNTYDPTQKPGWLLPIEMRFRLFTNSGDPLNIVVLDSTDIKARLDQWCRDAIVFLDPKSENLGSHVEKLDDLLSPLIICSFLVHKQKWSRDEIIDRACALLARIPSYPPEIPYEYTGKRGQSHAEGPWPEEYLATPSSSSPTTTARTLQNEYKWSNLRVLSKPSTNVVRIALFLVMQRSVPVGFLSAYLDALVTLLDTATEFLLQNSKSTADARAWREALEKMRPNYMCKWAFELLRTDLSSVTQDFRRMFEIYNVHFGDRAPRCNVNPTVAGKDNSSSSGKLRVCDGRAPGNCQRFESEGVQEQSAHDVECLGSACGRPTWDEQSYKNIKGARAVSLEETDEEYIRYCPVSTETMAVSHV